MKSSQPITTLIFYPRSSVALRTFALWYFTALIILWNLAGHTMLGFEQAWATPILSVGTALVLQFLLEWVDARANDRPLRFLASWLDFINFLPVAIIPGLACAMLLYPNEQLGPVMFAAALSICSKVIFRAPVGGGKTQHIFNPSNLGITATLLLFPDVGLAPPYNFTENLSGMAHWVLPGLVILTGLVVHGMATGRLVLVVAWLFAFIAQGQIRAWIFNIPWVVPLTPTTSASFSVFTLYMIPDPATTPIKPWRQVLFAVSIAAIYAILFVEHIVFGLFIALAVTSALRGAGLYLLYFQSLLGHKPAQQAEPARVAHSSNGTTKPVSEGMHAGGLVKGLGSA